MKKVLFILAFVLAICFSLPVIYAEQEENSCRTPTPICPTEKPTAVPTVAPTEKPTIAPTEKPTPKPCTPKPCNPCKHKCNDCKISIILVISLFPFFLLGFVMGITFCYRTDICKKKKDKKPKEKCKDKDKDKDNCHKQKT